ncbi:MAG: hypothetical protein II756_01675 [Clostridia bacterium]|nr:hypothetical protein [Clostridia bacterium]
MDNKTIYSRTLGFSLRRVLWDLISIVLVIALTALGFILGEKISEGGAIIGLIIGMIVGIVAAVLIARFISYTLKAGQIAMMTRGVTEGELPDDIIGEGKRTVKERFATVAAFFAITGAIKGIFNQIGRGIAKLGQSIGGDAGGAVGGAVSSAMQTVIAYLCDCCLGWVFYRSGVNAAKAACEGAVLFFKHGKTFIKNMGRVFGMGLASFIVIGGIFGGISYLLLSGHEEFYAQVAAQFTEAAASEGANALVKLLADPAAVPVVFAAIAGIVMWGILHSTFIRPFVLVGVLRNYMASGINDVPTEESFAALDAKSPRFRKLHSQI